MRGDAGSADADGYALDESPVPDEPGIAHVDEHGQAAVPSDGDAAPGFYGNVHRAIVEHTSGQLRAGGVMEDGAQGKGVDLSENNGSRARARVPMCRWCGKAEAEHLEERPLGAAQPRIPCLGLKSGFLVRDQAKVDPETHEFRVHLVQLWLCEACLLGTGQECHTPGCALFLHNSPGFPIMRELYTLVAPPEPSEADHG